MADTNGIGQRQTPVLPKWLPHVETKILWCENRILARGIEVGFIAVSWKECVCTQRPCLPIPFQRVGMGFFSLCGTGQLSNTPFGSLRVLLGRIHCPGSEIFAMEVWLKFKNLLLIVTSTKCRSRRTCVNGAVV